jgi:hypothetical protein
VLSVGFEALQPGEVVTVVLRDRSLGSASGQVLAADGDRITIVEPAEGRSGSRSLEEIPTAAIASVTRRGFAPLPAPDAAPEAADGSAKRSVAIAPGGRPAGLQRGAGLILLAFAALLFNGAANALVVAGSRDPDAGEAELMALGRLGAVVLVGVGLVWLTAAWGVLRNAAWGTRLGLVVSSVGGVFFSLTVLGSPAPWDYSANLGIYQASAVEWLLGLVPALAAWIAVAALLGARR